jgi:hypothetical protein
VTDEFADLYAPVVGIVAAARAGDVDSALAIAREIGMDMAVASLAGLFVGVTDLLCDEIMKARPGEDRPDLLRLLGLEAARRAVA